MAFQSVVDRTAGGYLCYNINVGQRGRKLMPHSEVCMSMQVAGKYMDFEVLDGSVQLFVTNDKTERFTEHFSAPILLGEAGVKREGKGFYYLPHETDMPADELATVKPV